MKTMPTGFMDVPSNAMINLSPDIDESSVNGNPNTYVVNRVSVPQRIPSNRGQGIASRLFADVCAEADRQGITLILMIHPDGSTGSLTYPQLVAWYRRLGFRPSVENPGWWKRVPQFYSEHV
jgi:predicted N-acetyltransferase YhbS